MSGFEIGHNIAYIISDNASNMTKAFSVPGFGVSKDSSSAICSDSIDDENDFNSDDETEGSLQNIEDCLPVHSRYYAHRLQLVVKDGLKECNPHLKSVISKASQVVGFVRKSINASELLEDYKRLQAANATRLNFPTVYDTVCFKCARGKSQLARLPNKTFFIRKKTSK